MCCNCFNPLDKCGCSLNMHTHAHLQQHFVRPFYCLLPRSKHIASVLDSQNVCRTRGCRRTFQAVAGGRAGRRVPRRGSLRGGACEFSAHARGAVAGQLRGGAVSALREWFSGATFEQLSSATPAQLHRLNLAPFPTARAARVAAPAASCAASTGGFAVAVAASAVVEAAWQQQRARRWPCEELLRHTVHATWREALARVRPLGTQQMWPSPPCGLCLWFTVRLVGRYSRLFVQNNVKGIFRPFY